MYHLNTDDGRCKVAETFVYWASEASPTLGVQSRFRVIGERAKRARHSQVCSIENRIYVPYGCPTLPGYATGRPVA